MRQDEKNLLHDWFSRVRFDREEHGTPALDPEPGDPDDDATHRRRVTKKIEAGTDSPYDADTQWEWKHGWIPASPPIITEEDIVNIDPDDFKDYGNYTVLKPSNPAEKISVMHQNDAGEVQTKYFDTPGQVANYLENSGVQAESGEKQKEQDVDDIMGLLEPQFNNNPAAEAVQQATDNPIALKEAGHGSTVVYNSGAKNYLLTSAMGQQDVVSTQEEALDKLKGYASVKEKMDKGTPQVAQPQWVEQPIDTVPAPVFGSNVPVGNDLKAAINKIPLGESQHFGNVKVTAPSEDLNDDGAFTVKYKGKTQKITAPSAVQEFVEGKVGTDYSQQASELYSNAENAPNPTGEQKTGYGFMPYGDAGVPKSGYLVQVAAGSDLHSEETVVKGMKVIETKFLGTDHPQFGHIPEDALFGVWKSHSPTGKDFIMGTAFKHYDDALEAKAAEKFGNPIINVGTGEIYYEPSGNAKVANNIMEEMEQLKFSKAMTVDEDGESYPTEGDAMYFDMDDAIVIPEGASQHEVIENYVSEADNKADGFVSYQKNGATYLVESFTTDVDSSSEVQDLYDEMDGMSEPGVVSFKMFGHGSGIENKAAVDEYKDEFEMDEDEEEFETDFPDFTIHSRADDMTVHPETLQKLAEHTQDLPPEQAGSLNRYTQGSGELNENLRGSPRSGSDSAKANRNIENIDQAMEPIPEELTVYRAQDRQFFPADLDVGEYTWDNAFVSTTFSPRVMETFGGANKIKMTITVPEDYPAVYLEPITSYKNEQEILLPRGSILKLESKKGIHWNFTVVLPDEVEE